MHTIQKQINRGDLAVDGIFTGIEAGIIMAVFLVVVSASQRISASEVLVAFSLQQPGTLIGGLLTHLALSCIYGILFSLCFYFIGRRNAFLRNTISGLAAGLAYGVILFLAAEFFLFNITATLLERLPLTLLLVAHLVYGLALGLLIQRRQRSSIS
jgi:hypothetical protein